MDASIVADAAKQVYASGAASSACRVAKSHGRFEESHDSTRARPARVYLSRDEVIMIRAVRGAASVDDILGRDPAAWARC